jgi:hypothetical protein
MLIVQSLGIIFRGLTVHCRCLSRYGKHRVKESCLLPPKRILLSAGPCFAKDMWRWGVVMKDLGFPFFFSRLLR